MQCTHRAVSIQWTLVSEGTRNRFGSQRKTLARNFKVVFYLQPWSETVTVENTHVELLTVGTRLTVSCHSSGLKLLSLFARTLFLCILSAELVPKPMIKATG